MNSGLQPPSALVIVRELIGHEEREALPAWIEVALAILVALLPALALLVGGAS